MKSNQILHSIYVNERENQLIISRQQQQYNDINNNRKVYNDYYYQHYRYHYNGVICSTSITERLFVSLFCLIIFCEQQRNYHHCYDGI